MAKKTTSGAESKPQGSETKPALHETPGGPSETLGLGDEPHRDGDDSQIPGMHEQPPDEPRDEAHSDGDGGHQLPTMPVRARQGDDGRPFCPTHNCLQIASGSKDNHTHYRCPVPGCSTREKRARPQVKVPSEPQRCPQLVCRNKLSFLEVDVKFSKVSHLRMCCPACGFAMDVPRPQFDPTIHMPRPTEDLAAR